MSPELKVGDVLIIDPDQAIRPGGIVVASHQEMSEVTARRYKQVSAISSMQQYELIPTNDNWATIRGDQSSEHRIIGVVLACFRLF